jgi:uncharacterized membrane protein HdeD (DUF308 family)
MNAMTDDRGRIDLLNATLARNWWAIALRGVFGILFGLVALTLPGATMLSLVLIFAAYMLADGVFAIIAAFRAAAFHHRWGPLGVAGIADILAGVIALAWPDITILVFVFLVAAWALVTGALILAAAFRLHWDHGRFWLALGGVVSLLYGLLLVAAPFLGALVLTWWIGAYALLFGTSLLLVSLRLRARHHDRHGHSQMA